MEKIWVFDFRCYHKLPGCPIECYREEGIDAEGDYETALAEARKEFKRRNQFLQNVDNEQIEVLTYTTA